MSQSQDNLTKEPQTDGPPSSNEEINEDNKTESAPKEKSPLSTLTPQIIEALTFDISIDNVDLLREKTKQLQMLLRKVIELLKIESQACGRAEKQNLALTVQVDALKDVVGITKDLLSIRNMEVQHLQTDMNKMEEKISAERQRHNAMLERMNTAAKLNQNLKNEYQTQLGLFQDLREKYDEKVTILTNENKRLQGIATEEGELDENVTLNLETIPPR